MRYKRSARSKTEIVLIALLTIGVVSAIFLFGGQGEERLLVPTKQQGKWGYIDPEGNWRIPPQFEEAVLLSENLAAVRSTAGWGFIDKNGKERIPIQFSAVRNFKSGRAAVRLGRRWGYVDTEGKMIVQPQFQTASDFHDGLARIEFWDSVCGMTNDTAPEEYFDRKFTSMSVIPSAGCGAVNSRIGYVNRDGALMIEPRYADGSDFSEGTAVVTRADWGARGYIDTKGNLILPFKYALADPFSEGLAAVRLLTDNLKSEGTIVIDQKGKQVFERRFQHLRPFSEGLAPFQADVPDGVAWGYIDTTGRTVIRPLFAQAFPFSEGLAVVWLGNIGNQAYIDKTGRVVLRVPQGAEAKPIQSGIAMVKLRDGRVQYFDKTGVPLVPRQ